jgi:hypothetical protein
MAQILTDSPLFTQPAAISMQGGAVRELLAHPDTDPAHNSYYFVERRPFSARNSYRGADPVEDRDHTIESGSASGPHAFVDFVASF